jgi:hypothetical protein
MEELKPFVSIISQDDVDDACDFAEDFSAELESYKGRLTGTREETATARLIRDRLHNETNAKVRLEAYKARPIAGRGSLTLLGAWLALCLVIYFVSFVDNRTVGIILALVALVLAIAGGIVIMLLFLGHKKLQTILPKKVSYNVVSERAPSVCEAGKERTVIIASNHDAVLGSAIYDLTHLRTFSLIVAPISFVIFVVFCILKMVIGPTTPLAISLLTIFPFLTTVAGASVLMTHFSLSKKHARDRGGVSTSVALATYAFFVENPDLLPNDVRLVFASFGGENSAHGGSCAFVKAHSEYSDAKVLCIGDVLDNNFGVSDGDHLRGVKHSDLVVDAVIRAGREQDVALQINNSNTLRDKLVCLHGFTSNAFAQSNIHSATITAKHDNAVEGVVRREDVGRLFALSVTAVSHLLEDEIS